jgi:hypothetical protein
MVSTQPIPARRRIPTTAAHSSRFSALGPLVTATLLLLTIGLGPAAVRATGPDPAARLRAAIVATPAATPARDVAPIPLLRLTLDPTWTRGFNWHGIDRATYAPGGHTRDVSKGAPQLYFVEQGAFTVRSVDGPPPLQVAGGVGEAAATPPVGGELHLVAGDAVLLPAGSTVDLHNDGGAPAALLWLQSGAEATRLENVGMLSKILAFTVVDRRGEALFQAPPVALALDRVVLAPDAVLPGPEAGGLVVVGMAEPLTYAQRIALHTEAGNVLHNTGTMPLDLYVVRVTALAEASPVAGTPSG